MRHLGWVAGMVVAAGLVFPLPAPADKPDNPDTVREVDATVRWWQRVVLGLTVSGIVSEVRIEPGQAVRRGEVMLRLDPRGFEARVAERRARLGRVEPELEEAERELARMRDLYDRTLLSDHELQVASVSRARLAAARAEAGAAVTRAELELEGSILRAPFDGMVVKRTAAVGQAVVNRCTSVPLVVLVSTDRLAARAYLSLDETKGLAPGQEVVLVRADGHQPATVEHVAFEPEAAGAGAGRYVLDVVFEPRARGPWRVGEAARLRLSGAGGVD